MMHVISPKVRGFVCVTAHPEGCAKNVENQINYVLSQPQLPSGPKRVLVIGCSTGYGLATRIALAFGCGASTLGVCFERPSENDKPASAGWYNVASFEQQAKAKGLYAYTLNADAFAQDTQKAVIERALADWGPGSVDMVIYSLASPRRTDPQTGQVYKSVLKPIGQAFSSLHLDTDKKKLSSVTLEPASPEEIQATVKVMGGEDWTLWIQALAAANLLAQGACTVAYSYIGPQVTWPIYKAGTIGKAKEHLEQSAISLNQELSHLNLRAYVSVNKAVVTQASSAIPVVPLYLALLFKTMKARGTHEGCIEQMYRLLSTHLCAPKGPMLDQEGRIRLDDWEMDPLVQQTVADKWQQLKDDNLHELTDFAGYQEEFLKLFGFGLSGIDYQKPIPLEIPWPAVTP